MFEHLLPLLTRGQIRITGHQAALPRVHRALVVEFQARVLGRILEGGDICYIGDLVLIDNFLLYGAPGVEEVDAVIDENHEEFEGGGDVDGAEAVLLVRVGVLLRLVQELFVDEKGKVVFVERLLVSQGEKLTPRLHHGIIEL